MPSLRRHRFSTISSIPICSVRSLTSQGIMAHDAGAPVGRHVHKVDSMCARSRRFGALGLLSIAFFLPNCGKSANDDGGDSHACVTGAEGCACTAGGACDAGLTCATFRGRNVVPGDAGIVAEDESAGILGAAKSVGAGRVFLFHDEWVTYESQWSGEGIVGAESCQSGSGGPCEGLGPAYDYQAAQFWFSALTWASSNVPCFNIEDPTIVK